jgi:hypothetical protein
MRNVEGSICNQISNIPPLTNLWGARFINFCLPGKEKPSPFNARSVQMLAQVDEDSGPDARESQFVPDRNVRQSEKTATQSETSGSVAFNVRFYFFPNTIQR